MNNHPTDSPKHPTHDARDTLSMPLRGTAEGGLVIGVDGCPGGWIAVQWGRDVRHVLCRTFEDVLALDGGIIAIDMPIGFLDIAEPGGRQAERLARQILKGRASCVFPTPARPALIALDHSQANELNRHYSVTKTLGLSCQTVGLLKKMREIDGVMTAGLQERVHESHPEVAFAMMNGNLPVMVPKKSTAGREARIGLLKQSNFPYDRVPPLNYLRKDVGRDDLIDACACAWVAHRISRGCHTRLPPDPPRDAKGLRMEINA